MKQEISHQSTLKLLPGDVIVANSRSTPEPQEEVLFSKVDTGWHREIPVTLFTYADGSQDLHRQTGLQFKEHIAEAAAILKERGLSVAQWDGDLWPTGIYLTVTPVSSGEAPST